MSAVPGADLAGAKLLGALWDGLAMRGIALTLAEVNEAVRRTLQPLELDRDLAVQEPQQSIRENVGAAAP
ncbi:MAG: STAS domain-containing protein [Gammaproteobacteria bacterium]|jgi:anti-anti-sigma regulatory factor